MRSPGWPKSTRNRKELRRSVFDSAGRVVLALGDVWKCNACEATDDAAIAPTLCARCGTLDSYEEARVHAVPARELLAVERVRVPTGDPAFDSLLLGGIVRGGRVVLFGKPGGGKSRLALRWSSRLGNVVVLSLEMASDITASSAQSAGADVERLSIVESVDGFERLAKAQRAKAIVLDSVTEYADARGWKDARALLDRLRAWADSTGGIALAVSQATKAGDYSGPRMVGHWPDYVIRVGRRKDGRARVTIAKSRFCPVGSCVLPIAETPP